MSGVMEHLERYLGLVQEGWAVDADGREMPFQIVRFDQGSTGGTVSFSTLGLGRYPLKSPATGRTIRHELLLLVRDDSSSGLLPSLLQQVGESARWEGVPPWRCHRAARAVAPGFADGGLLRRHAGVLSG